VPIFNCNIIDGFKISTHFPLDISYVPIKLAQHKGLDFFEFNLSPTTLELLILSP